jgi:hypothetical protein
LIDSAFDNDLPGIWDEHAKSAVSADRGAHPSKGLNKQLLGGLSPDQIGAGDNLRRKCNIIGRWKLEGYFPWKWFERKLRTREFRTGPVPLPQSVRTVSDPCRRTSKDAPPGCRSNLSPAPSSAATAVSMSFVARLEVHDWSADVAVQISLREFPVEALVNEGMPGLIGVKTQ